jgi:hypothetical protein
MLLASHPHQFHQALEVQLFQTPHIHHHHPLQYALGDVECTHQLYHWDPYQIIYVAPPVPEFPHQHHPFIQEEFRLLPHHHHQNHTQPPNIEFVQLFQG